MNIKGKVRFVSARTKTRIKSLFNTMLDYAVEYEIVDRNYSKAFAVSEDIIADMENSRTEHIAFTENELATLWSHVTDTKYVDIVLIQCYSGWRPQELGLIKLENVDL